MRSKQSKRQCAEILHIALPTVPASRKRSGNIGERARRVHGKAHTEERLQSRHGVGEVALNRIPVGVTVTDAVANVNFMNPFGRGARIALGWTVG